MEGVPRAIEISPSKRSFANSDRTDNHDGARVAIWDRNTSLRYCCSKLATCNSAQLVKIANLDTISELLVVPESLLVFIARSRSAHVSVDIEMEEGT